VISFESDLRAIMSPAEMGAVAIIETPLGPRHVPGILNRRTGSLAEMDALHPGVSAHAPDMLVRSSDLVGIPVNARLTVAGVAYVIALAEPDNTGATRLFLRREV
jgi:hypothetical protein